MSANRANLILKSTNDVSHTIVLDVYEFLATPGVV